MHGLDLGQRGGDADARAQRQWGGKRISVHDGRNRTNSPMRAKKAGDFSAKFNASSASNLIDYDELSPNVLGGHDKH